VYSTTNIGGVTAVDADTGAYLWSSVTDGLVQGAPVAIANSVFIGSLAGDVVSYDVNYQGSSASGNPAWLNKANSIDKFVVGNSPLTQKPKLRALVPDVALRHSQRARRWPRRNLAQQN
jgi:outer membrane protein assembly factor BamB